MSDKFNLRPYFKIKTSSILQTKEHTVGIRISYESGIQIVKISLIIKWSGIKANGLNNRQIVRYSKHHWNSAHLPASKYQTISPLFRKLIRLPSILSALQKPDKFL